MELNDLDRAELGRLIAEGSTGGRLDSEDDDGNAVYFKEIKKYQLIL